MFFGNPNSLITYFRDSLERFPKLDVTLDAELKRLRAQQSPLLSQYVLDQLFAIRINNAHKSSFNIKNDLSEVGNRLYEIYTPSPQILFELFRKYPTIFNGNPSDFSMPYLLLYAIFKTHAAKFVTNNSGSDSKFANIKFYMSLEEMNNFYDYLFNALAFTDQELARLVQFMLEVGTNKFCAPKIVQNIIDRDSLTAEQKQELILPIILTCDYIYSNNNIAQTFRLTPIYEIINALCKASIDSNILKPFLNDKEIADLFESYNTSKGKNYARDMNHFRPFTVLIVFLERSAHFKNQYDKHKSYVLRIFEHIMKRSKKDGAAWKIYCVFEKIASDSILEKSVLYMKQHKLPIYMLDIVIDLWSYQSKLSIEEFSQQWNDYLAPLAKIKSARGHHVFERAVIMNKLLNLQHNIMRSALPEQLKIAMLLAITKSDRPALLATFLEIISTNIELLESCTKNDINIPNIIGTVLPKFSMQKHDALLQQEPRLIDFLAFILKHQTAGNIVIATYAYKLLDLLATENAQAYYAVRRNRHINDHLNAILEQRPDLEKNWFAGAKQELDAEYTIVDTDNWRHIMFYGVDMENCQSLTYHTHMFNAGLLGHLFNGTTRLYAIVNKDNKVQAYMLARLVFDKTNDHVVLCLDAWQLHSRLISNESTKHPGMKEKLYAFAKERAAELGCNLYIRPEITSGENGPVNAPENNKTIYTLEGVAPLEHNELDAKNPTTNHAKKGAMKAFGLRKLAL